MYVCKPTNSFFNLRGLPEACPAIPEQGEIKALTSFLSSSCFFFFFASRHRQSSCLILYTYTYIPKLYIFIHLSLIHTYTLSKLSRMYSSASTTNTDNNNNNNTTISLCNVVQRSSIQPKKKSITTSNVSRKGHLISDGQGQDNRHPGDRSRQGSGVKKDIADGSVFGNQWPHSTFLVVMGEGKGGGSS
ncbi:hypothetical protein F4810DRAFT_113708 [Camillea tinctor]|nr:hypothetical protein F4810DRAFT_113708 [Camillea tinctor]